MQDQNKTKRQLINELVKLQQRIAELEISENERKRAEEALRESESRLRIILESVQTGIVMIDYETHQILDANPIAVKMIGDPKEQIIGSVCHKYICPAEKGQCPITDLGQSVDHSERLLLTAGGEKCPIVKTVVPVIIEGQKRLVESYMDITELKRMEEALRQKTEDLIRSNQELEQFVYVASHDLQEPIRMVTSFVQLLERRYKDKLDQDANEFIGFAVDGAMRMHTLINDFLTYSRVATRGKALKPTDCQAVLEQSLGHLKVVLKESGAEVTHDPLPTVMADSSQLEQLFQNLIGNAVKFHGQRSPKVHISASLDGNRWIFSVRDNGIGIAPEFKDSVFIIFRRLHGNDKYPGTGMGLGVCKKVVERHGGRIWVESEPGKGATFYFTLPKEGEHQT